MDPKGTVKAQTSLFVNKGDPDKEPLQGWQKAHVESAIHNLVKALDGLGLAAKVEALNRARTALHAVSPFASEPVDCVLWIPRSESEPNGWNPNAVAPPEMVALTHSMKTYGITMPIVGARLESGPVRITDGFHRHVVCGSDPEVSARVHGYLPFSLLQGAMTEADQMSATVLHNQARGTHSVEREVAIVAALDKAGWSDERVGVGLVKTDEELIRMRQLGGAAPNLASGSYGRAWAFGEKSK